MKSLAIVLVLGCAPALPSELPAGSAASEKAREAPLPHAPLALTEDPPLPSENSSRWVGLQAPDNTTGGMQDMPGMSHDMRGMNMGDAGAAPVVVEAGAKHEH